MKMLKVLVVFVGLFSMAPAAFGGLINNDEVAKNENRSLKGKVGGQQECEVKRKLMDSDRSDSSGAPVSARGKNLS